jgi:hypothetical protein
MRKATNGRIGVAPESAGLCEAQHADRLKRQQTFRGHTDANRDPRKHSVACGLLSARKYFRIAPPVPASACPYAHDGSRITLEANGVDVHAPTMMKGAQKAG